MKRNTDSTIICPRCASPVESVYYSDSAGKVSEPTYRCAAHGTISAEDFAQASEAREVAERLDAVTVNNPHKR